MPVTVGGKSYATQTAANAAQARMVTTAPPAQNTGSPVNSNPPAPAGQTTTYNPNIAGAPYMGNNAANANATAQGASKAQAVASTPSQPQTQAQLDASRAASSVNTPIYENKAAGTFSNKQYDLQGQLVNSPQTQPQQTLNQIAPQALLEPVEQKTQQFAGTMPQTTIQEQQTGGFPVQHTQAPLPQVGTLTAPQTVTNVSQQPAPQIDPNATVQAYNNSTNQTETVSSDDSRFSSGQLTQNPVGYQTGQTSPQQNLTNALQSHQQQDFSSMLQQAMQAGPNASGADMLKLNLQQQLGAIDDPNINTYLNNQIARTSQAYQMGMGYNSASSQELQDAINGTLTSAQTITGTQAKQAAQARDLNLQSLTAQSEWNKAQQTATVDQLQTKRADLEGFLKAQLALSAGSDTGPSTAALTVMSQSLHAADINMTLQNASYTYGQAQLSIQGSKVMTDYTNQVMTLGAQLNEQRMKTTSDYYDGLSKIDQNALANEQQKRQLTSAAYGTYSQQMVDLNNQQANRQVQYATLAHTTIQDNITDANAISGLTGTVYQPDGKGGFQQAVDANGQPVKTFDWAKNQFTQAHDIASLQLQASAQNITIAQSAITNAQNLGYLPGDKGWNDTINQISQTMGYPDGMLSQFKTYNGLNTFIHQSSGAAQMIHQEVGNATSMNQVPQTFKDVFGVGTVVKDSDGKPIQCGVWAGSISTAPNVGDTWQQKLSTVQKYGSIQDNPQAGYKLLIPLGVNTDGQGGMDKNGHAVTTPGHVETVLSFDPNTRNALIVDANRTGPGQVGMRIENLDDLQSKYGANWGFVPGQLKPGIQQKINGLGQSTIQQETPPSPNMSKISNAINDPTSSPASDIYANKAKQLAAGDIKESDLSNLPSGAQLRIQREATKLNPMYSASASDFKTDWLSPSGTSGAAINSFNTAIKHLGVLSDVYSKMKNQGITKVNEMQNWLKANASDPNVSEYSSIVNGVADEVAKASTGGAPSVADKAESAAAFDINKGPAALLSSIQGQMELMGGKTQTLINNYKKKMGEYPKDTFDPEASAAFKKLGMNPAQFDASLRNYQSPIINNFLNDPNADNADKQALSAALSSGNYNEAHGEKDITTKYGTKYNQAIPTSDFVQGGGQMNTFQNGSIVEHKDGLGLGVGGDTLKLF